jgi:hypothetical protein
MSPEETLRHQDCFGQPFPIVAFLGTIGLDNDN